MKKLTFKIIGRIFTTIFIITLFSLIGWLIKYNYNDCLMVGHTKLYCILKLGN